MVKVHLLYLFLICTFQYSFAQNITPLSIGEICTIHSEILQEDRTLNIYLPLSYHSDSTNTYPVIYLLDGSMDEDFIHIAGLVQFSSFSWIDRIPEAIVVGIANVNRQRDFTMPISLPLENWNLPKGFNVNRINFTASGGSTNFIRFIENELQTFVEKQYRTNTKKAIIGQSLGGLLATEILLTKPDLFTDYLIVSPSLWWNGQSLLNKDSLSLKSDRNIFISVGNEGKVMVRDAKRLYKHLKTTSPNNTSIYFSFHDDCDHNDVLHEAIYEALKKPLLR